MQINRTKKPKVRVMFKDCVLSLNGRDYLVKKATGQLDEI